MLGLTKIISQQVSYAQIELVLGCVCNTGHSVKEGWFLVGIIFLICFFVHLTEGIKLYLSITLLICYYHS